MATFKSHESKKSRFSESIGNGFETQQREIIRDFFTRRKTFEGAKEDAFEFFASEINTSAVLVKEVVGRLLNERRLAIQTQTSFDPEQKTSADVIIFTPQDKTETESVSTRSMIKPQKNESCIQEPEERACDSKERVDFSVKSRPFLDKTKEAESSIELFRELFGLSKNKQETCIDPLKGIQDLLCDYCDRKVDVLELLKQVRGGADNKNENLFGFLHLGFFHAQRYA